ncbi:hypothetical protein ACFE04_010860 [Oxalis oulophora]
MFPHNNDKIPVLPSPLNNANASSSTDEDGKKQIVLVPTGATHNGGFLLAESLIANPTERLQADLLELGKKVHIHEGRIKILKAQAAEVQESILDLDVTLGKYASSNVRKKVTEDHSQGPSEQEIIEEILRHEKCAAGIVCHLIKSHPSIDQFPWAREVIGVVAILGKVDDENLSRLFSEYLGVENMLAIVCKTYEGAKSLETYFDKEDDVSKNLGLHSVGSSIGKKLEGRFQVICLDSIRPYAGGFIADDLQKRLDIVKPRLPNGECPPGFLGFAVNMVKVDIKFSYNVTKDGHGLRETLFYSLFSRLQVYKTRADMMRSRPCISHGALSLDGGMIKTTGVFCLGDRGEVKVRFPKSTVISKLPEHYIETEKQIMELKWKKEKLLKDEKKEQTLLDCAKSMLARKKDEFVHCLAQTGLYANQQHHQAAQGLSSARRYIFGDRRFS